MSILLFWFCSGRHMSVRSWVRFFTLIISDFSKLYTDRANYIRGQLLASENLIRFSIACVVQSAPSQGDRLESNPSHFQKRHVPNKGHYLMGWIYLLTDFKKEDVFKCSRLYLLNLSSIILKYWRILVTKIKIHSCECILI